MKKQISKIYLPLLICSALLIALVNSAKAQTAAAATPTNLTVTAISSTPTLLPTLTPTPVGTVQLTNPDIVPFSQFRQGEIQLTGPYDSASIYFTLPADWVLKDGIQLNLKLGVSSNVDAQNTGNVIIASGGTLTIRLNGTVIHIASLSQSGETEIKINIPLPAELNNNDEMSLQIVLDSASSCRLIGANTNVYIHPTSYLYFPHDLAQPTTNLVDFPKPIFQNSFTPDSALLVLPDQPTPAELQAALTVAAGFGKLSGNRLLLDMTTWSNFKDDLTKQHIILVGKAGSLALLNDLNLPLPSSNGRFQLKEGGDDDGLIQMINSPWSKPHVVLVVSANTDAGIIKAAQAVSSGFIRPNEFENLAIIKQINDLPTSGLQAVDQTLSDLGYELRSFQNKGESGQGYIFNVPKGMTVSNDAYFDVVFGHSSLINYNASQIVVLLNGQPIGSIRMSDTTASLPTNHAKIMIPPAAILPGINRLRVTVNLEPLDECIRPDSQGLWVNIWPESLIHLPLVPTSYDPELPQDLATYPAPFIFNPTLGNTAFVLERNDFNAWKNAMHIAFSLGSETSGDIIQLSTFYGDEFPAAERANYHLLVIGRPSQMPIIGEMNDYLPAPFVSDAIVENDKFPVTYRIYTDSPMGYIETMRSPWNPENVVLALLGNTTQGVNWAAAGLIDPTLSWRLSGNFAVLNDKQLISSNTRYTVESDSSVVPVIETPSISPTSLSETLPNQTQARPDWVLPVLIVSTSLITIIVAIVILQSRARTNNQKQPREKFSKESSK